MKIPLQIQKEAIQIRDPMSGRTKGRPAIADYTVWTNELGRVELMIILNGIKIHRINRAKRKLQYLREHKGLNNK